MTTISSGTLTFTPELVTAWETSQTSRNVLHTIIGKADPDVTLKPSSTRSGTLEMLFLSASSANTARGILANGTISTVLEDTTRNLWTISADYTEVIA